MLTRCISMTTMYCLEEVGARLPVSLLPLSYIESVVSCVLEVSAHCFMYVSRFLPPEPSAELLMNMSRSRRLIVLLSYAYLEQEWCCANFRCGFFPVPPHDVSVAVTLPCFPPQAGPAAPAGAVSASRHRHRAGGSVQAHEARRQAADWRAPPPADCAHVEAQLRGETSEKTGALLYLSGEEDCCIFFVSLLFRFLLLSSGRS